MSHTASDSPVTFGLTRVDGVVIGSVCVAVGIALGFFLPAIANFASRFPIPFGGLFEALSSFDNPVVVIARPAIGAVLGLVVTAAIIMGSPRLTIGSDGIEIAKRDAPSLRITRESFFSAYYNTEGQLTILTKGGHQAFVGSVEGKKDRVAAAFKDRGYRWGEI